MKKSLLILIFIAPLFVHAQLTDNFSDGDFTNNPIWSGDASKWQVASGQLQSNNSVANDTFYLSTASVSASDVQWELYMKLDFSTSSNNYVDIYLISDQANLKSSLNGYFVRVGNTADEIALYRRDGAAFTKIIDGVDGRSQLTSTNNLIKVKVTRTLTNDWTLFDDVTGTGTIYFTEGMVNDATYLASAFFGISARQSTASFFNKHYFDNVYVGPIILDTIPPVIISTSVLSDSLLDVTFNEPVEQLSAETASNYSVNNSIGSAASVSRDATNLSLVHLTFSTHFTEGLQNTLTVNGVKDLALNPIGTTGNTMQFTWYNPQPADSGDVIINEVLFSVRTGGVEFVELFNRSNKAIYLKDLKFTRIDLTSGLLDPSVQLTTGNELLVPGGYMVLTDNPTIVKSQYFTEDPNAFLQMSLPDLLTDEDILVLLGSSSQTLDQLHYYSAWHFPLLNDLHGVSLERLNPNRRTQDETNWHSAAETVDFATPGYKNSQNDHSQGDGSEISVKPEIFSPDEDGHNDIVNVHYHFDNPGNVASVNVYDSKGRLIRNLVNNELLGNDGSFAWDGVTNEKDKARIGMYIFYIEVFDIKGDTRTFKKTCVLASKL